jgi:hypothetical protein
LTGTQIENAGIEDRDSAVSLLLSFKQYVISFSVCDRLLKDGSCMKKRNSAYIQHALVNSFLKGTAIGIKLKNNNALIVTAVASLNMQIYPQWIETRPYTLYGSPISQPVMLLSNIESVLLFSVNYDDPLYTRHRELKAKIFGRD